MVIRVEVDADEPIRMYREAVRAFQPPLITRAVEAAAEVYQQGAYFRAPWRTGRLARSIRRERVNETTVDVTSDVVYAPVHEYGAVIEARYKPYLKFQINGRWVQKRRVRIPARPYFRPTFQHDSARAEAAFHSELERVMKF